MFNTSLLFLPKLPDVCAHCGDKDCSVRVEQMCLKKKRPVNKPSVQSTTIPVTHLKYKHLSSRILKDQSLKATTVRITPFLERGVDC